MKNKIKQQAAPENLPSRVIFEITQRCNYNCPDCLKGSELNELAEETILNIGKKIVIVNAPSVSWTGGEPYLVKNFLAIARIISQLGKVTIHSVNTNGSLINQRVADETAEIFNLARVTIYGTPISFSHNTGAVKKFTFETSINAIDCFLNSNLPVQVNIPLFNSGEVDFILEFLEERYGNRIEEVVLIPRIISSGELSKKIIFQDDQKNPSLNSAIYSYSFPVRIFQWQPGKHMVIKADGMVYAHPVPGYKDYALLIGDARTENIPDLWNKFPLAFVNHHRKLTPDLFHLKKK